MRFFTLKLFFLFHFLIALLAGSQTRIDSLLQQFNSLDVNDTSRIKTALLINEYYEGLDSDSGKIYIEKIISEIENFKLSPNLKDKWKAKLLVGKASLFWAENKQRESLSLKMEAIKLLQKNNDLFEVAAIVNEQGVLYVDNSNHEFASRFLKIARILRQLINDYDGLATSLNNLAFCYQQQGNIVQSLDYYHECLRIREIYINKSGDKKALESYAIALNNTSSIYLNQADLKLALEYCAKAKDVYEQIKNIKGVGQCLNTMGVIEQRKKNYPEALKYFREGLKYHREAGYKKGIANTIVNIGFIFHRQNQLDSALSYYITGLSLKDEMNDFLGRVHVYINISRVYLMQNNLPTALKFALKSHEIALRQSNPENIRESSSLLYLIYKKLKNTEQALAMHELYIQMRDSLHNDDISKNAYRSELNYVYDKKAFNDSLNSREEKMNMKNKLEKEKSTRIVLFSGIILIGLFAFFAVNRLRLTSRQKKLIEEQKQVVESKQKEILDSIAYAQRIQGVLMTSEKYIERCLKSLRKQ